MKLETLKLLSEYISVPLGQVVEQWVEWRSYTKGLLGEDLIVALLEYEKVLNDRSEDA